MRALTFADARAIDINLTAGPSVLAAIRILSRPYGKAVKVKAVPVRGAGLFFVRITARSNETVAALYASASASGINLREYRS